jgi:hypothetical protein
MIGQGRGGKGTMTGGTGRHHLRMLVVLPLDEEIVMTQSMYDCSGGGGGGKGRRGGE